MLTRAIRRLRRAAEEAVVPCACLLVCAGLMAGRADAQAPPAPPGWVFTPGVTVGQVWDNNVTLSTEKGQAFGESASDFLTVITPRAALGFRGRWTNFSLNYSGSYEMYQQLSQLNAFDQRLATSFRQVLSRRFSLVSRNSLSRAPSTDAIDVPGVLFRRQGVTIDDYRGGLESRLSNRTSLSTLYTFQWLKYDDTNVPSPVQDLERGGFAHGAVVKLDHVLDSRWTVGSEYEMRQATVQNARDFGVQTAMGTATYQIDQRMTVSGGLGYAWLETKQGEPGQSAPTFRINLDRGGEHLRWNVGYRRSYIPSFGFGGTFSNQEFEAGLEAPLARRWEWQATTAVMQADALSGGEAGSLRSSWVRTMVAYFASRWMRIEGYYVGVFQNTALPGGHINRSRIGIQVAAATRTRIR